MASNSQPTNKSLFQQILANLKPHIGLKPAGENYWRMLGAELDKISVQSGDVTANVTQIVNQILGGDGGNGNGPANQPDDSSESAPILSGHSVTVGDALYFSGGSVGLADASNADRLCDGLCVKLTTINGVTRAWWISNENKIKVKLAAGETGLTPGVPLYLSAITPGAMTASANQTAAVTHQQCARFVRLAQDSNGNFMSSVAIANVHIIPPSSLPVSSAL